jgi:hypothetical protein
MNLFKNSGLFVTAAASAIALAALGAIATETYAGAGGAMGAERIQQLAALKATPGAQTVSLATGYGHAGGSLGIERVAGATKIKTYSAGQTTTPVLCRRAGISLRSGG